MFVPIRFGQMEDVRGLVWPVFAQAFQRVSLILYGRAIMKGACDPRIGRQTKMYAAFNLDVDILVVSFTFETGCPSFYGVELTHIAGQELLRVCNIPT